MALGLGRLLPRAAETVSDRSRRLRNAFFEQTAAEAKAAGIRFEWRQFILILITAAGGGVAAAALFSNIWFVAVGAALGFFMPKMWFFSVKYRRRKELLLNLPGNLRLLASKLRDCKSLQRSLEAALPLMTGVSKPLFAHMYDSLQIGLDVPTVLERARQQIRFKKFDELCQKLTAGNREGFHARAVDGIRESVADIDADIQLLQEIDTENERKRMEPFMVFSLSFAFPLLFRYMESQLTQEFHIQTTMQTGIGKFLIASMLIFVLIGLWQKDKLLRLNLDDL
ncbi:hypothetical protein [Paenibacillus graminis]|uniref:hypothetical protein n=1 Tax=Paenibacillus graminis TaxID=189425 RepID=UPI002DBD6F65|nr:hypothetical protein [Paenibacillus graminis]MEC0167372.1 hypothetical protein [Paenibacillus graminis]